MLLIRAIRVEDTAEGTAKYDVAAFINARQIWQGFVGGHHRSDGWAVLAGHISRAAGLQCNELKRSIEESLKIATGEAVHCPACNRLLGHAK